MSILSRFFAGCLIACAPVFSFAQSSFSGFDHISKLFGKAPGAQYFPSAIGPGGLATASGDVLIKPSGLKIPVVLKAPLPVGRLALLAGGCLSGGVIGPLGCALGLASIGIELKNHGVFGTCLDGSTDIFCKPVGDLSDGKLYRAMDDGNGWTAWNTWLASPELACRNLAALRTQYGVNTVYSYGSSTATSCTMPWSINGGSSGTMVKTLGSMVSSCVAGKYLVNGVCQDVPGLAPASHQELIDELNRIAAADYAANQRILQEMQKDVEFRGSAWPDDLRPVQAADPVDVVASPVTEPAHITKVETIPNGDGTTSTRTTSETRVVTPVVSGSTVGTVKVDFPGTTTSTSTTVHDTTGATSTQTTVVHDPAPLQETKFPDDYNREATQQKILTGEGAADMPDQGALVEAAKTQGTTDIGNLVTTVQTAQGDHSAWFSWVWTPPTGTCSPFAGSVHGYAISWDLCPTISNINSVLAWLFSIFSALEIYGQLFRKGD